MHLVHNHVLYIETDKKIVLVKDEGSRALSTNLQLLIVDRAEVDVCLEGLASYTRSQHVLACIVETVIHEDLGHVFDFGTAESSL